MTAITATGADTFSVTDNAGKTQEMSGEMLMQLLAMRGSQVCADELQVQMQKSNDVLDKIEEAEKYLAKMDDLKAQSRTGAKAMPYEMGVFMFKNDIAHGTVACYSEDSAGNTTMRFDPDQWAVNKENLQAYIHKLNGQSQMDYIRLQSLTNQNNRLFSLMDSIETKSNQTKSEIIRDIK